MIFASIQTSALQLMIRLSVHSKRNALAFTDQSVPTQSLENALIEMMSVYMIIIAIINYAGGNEFWMRTVIEMKIAKLIEAYVLQFKRNVNARKASKNPFQINALILELVK